MGLKQAIKELTEESSSVTEELTNTRFALSGLMAKAEKEGLSTVGSYALILGVIADGLDGADVPKFFNRQLKVLSKMLLKYA